MVTQEAALSVLLRNKVAQVYSSEGNVRSHRLRLGRFIVASRVGLEVAALMWFHEGESSHYFIVYRNGLVDDLGIRPKLELIPKNVTSFVLNTEVTHENSDTD